MSELLKKLLNLKTLDWSDPSVGFGFERPIPAWAWALVAGAAAMLALWSYSRLTGRAWARTTLGVVRSLLLVFVVMLLLGPQLVKRQELTEQDWVIVLVDRSASLGVGDVAPTGGAGAGPRTTREAQLQAAMEKSWPMWRELAKDRTVLWMGFDAGAFDLSHPAAATEASAQKPVVDLGAANGRRTSIGAALDQALARAAARPIAGVVIVSDGRSTDEPSRAAMRRLQAEKIPAHTVALGSEAPVGDLLVKRVDAPRLAFVNDVTPVRVEVERLGGVGRSSGKVRLVDKATGRVLDERSFEIDPAAAPEPGAPGVTPGERSVTVTLGDKGGTAGPQQWTVEIVPDAAAGAGGDLVATNNTAELSVEMIDRPMRVLFVDGYPRWEQRYLKNLLVREKSISCSTLILAPDRKYTQEGDVELDALPDSPERWAEYDAVILGDVRPDVFTKEQLTQLRDHVSQRGAGLIWIAGPSSVPQTWWGTPLADLLPFTKDATDGSTLVAPVVMRPTPAADRLGILRLEDNDEHPWPKELANIDTGWSQLRWVQRIEPSQIKPTVEMIATADFGASARTAEGGRPFPLLLQMKYGAGRVVYAATDETWRWRYGRGEALYERYWTPLIRMLGREALSRSGRAALLEVSPSRASVDQPVRVSMELLDQSLVDLGLASVVVRVVKKDESKPAGTSGQGAGAPSGVGTGVELTLRPEGGSTRMYSTVWVPSEAGSFTAEAADSALAGRIGRGQLAAELQVSLPDDELRAPEADHALLARLSSETGGVTIAPDKLAELPAHLPNRKVRIVNETTEPLWDTPLALILAVSLLTLEWVGRRVIKLV